LQFNDVEDVEEYQQLKDQMQTILVARRRQQLVRWDGFETNPAQASEDEDFRLFAFSGIRQALLWIVIQDNVNGNNVNDFPWQGDVRRSRKMVVKFKYPNLVLLVEGDGITDFDI
jgi:hypothetical protein